MNFFCTLVRLTSGWLVLVAILGTESTPALSAVVVVKDALGRPIQVSLPVQRVVALNSDSLEVIRALRAEGLVVGVFSEIVREPAFWGSLVEKPKVGSWREPNVEAIVSLNPDLVIAYERTPGPFLDRKLARFGIPVLRFNFYKVNSLEREVMTLGNLLDRRNEVLRFCRWHHDQLQRIRGRVAKISSRPKVYMECYTYLHTVGPGSGGDEMCTIAGGDNIASDLTLPYPRVTSEWVISQNPEVIVKAVACANGYSLAKPILLNKCKNAILKRPGWNNISAVTHSRVYVIDSAIWAGPRAIIGICYLAKWFHPSCFTDLNPESLHKDYLEKFQHIPYHGVFVSEEIQAHGYR